MFTLQILYANKLENKNNTKELKHKQGKLIKEINLLFKSFQSTVFLNK